MKADQWQFQTGQAEFITHKSVPSMRIMSSGGQVTLKNKRFSNGIIEFDLDPEDKAFFSFYFRLKDAGNGECFYFRTARAGFPKAIDAVQYAPFIDGVNLWDLLYHYQTNATFSTGQWNHVKLVISGKQMRAYVNDMKKPVLEVPFLESYIESGTIGFEGKGIVSNLVIRPDETEGLPPGPGIDPSHHDPRYLRSWQVSQPLVTPEKTDFSADFLPNAQTVWKTIEAERRGLVNLTREFGGSKSRRIVWLRTTITSETAQKKKMNLGFSDEVWVLINGQLAYVDKNLYGRPTSKSPDGRCDLENSAFMLPLKAGDNEILIGVAADFYGWAIVARLEDTEQIK